MKKLVSKIFLILLSTIVCLSSFVGCKTKNQGGIAVALGSEPNSLDPAISLTTDVRSYITCMFEGLVNLDANGELVEGNADSWYANETNTVYTFHIRDNAEWSNGEKITADDYKYAWLRVLNPETASGWASFLYYIKNAEAYNSGNCNAEDVGIEANGDLLIVEMESSCAFFAAMTAIQPYFPVYKDSIEKYGSAWSNSAESLISNGAFRLEAWEHNLRISVVKNENYWGKDLIKTSRISFELLENASVSINAYEAKNISYLEYLLTVDEMKQVDEVETADYTVTKFLSLNFNRTKFQDKNVREAIAIAFDREQLATLIGDGATPLCSFIPYGFYNKDKDADFRLDGVSEELYFTKTAEKNRAMELLNQAGYSSNNPLTIDYLTNTSSQNVALAEIVKSQLAIVGINVNIIALEGKVFNDRRASRDFDVVASSWAAEFPDISSYLYGFQSNDFNNYANYTNNEFDELYLELIQDSSATRYNIAHQAEDLVMSDIAAIPLFAKDKAFITQNGLKGYFHDVTGCAVLKYIWED